MANDSIPSSLRAWSATGTWVEVLGHRVWCSDAGSPGGSTLVLLHGFPTSSHDLHRVLPRLRDHHRVVVHDHVGFGLSQKPRDYSYSLLDQAQRAVALWHALEVERATIVAHDYGTSVATELLALREEGKLGLEIDSLVLSNGSVHIELADLTWPQLALRHPVFGPIMARLGSERFFKWRLRKTFAMPVSERDLQAMWDGVRMSKGRPRLAQIGRYIDERREHWTRWIGALERFDRPTLVLWGDQDPIAVPAIAEQLAKEIPGAELRWLEGVGHYPMLEAADLWADALLSFVTSDALS